MKDYTIYLFKSPDCTRGWMSYIKPGVYEVRATLTVKVNAENGTKAKNKAITLANNGFKGLEIVARNYADDIWGINNFPKLKEEISAL